MYAGGGADSVKALVDDGAAALGGDFFGGGLADASAPAGAPLFEALQRRARILRRIDALIATHSDALACSWQERAAAASGDGPGNSALERVTTLSRSALEAEVRLTQHMGERRRAAEALVKTTAATSR